MAKFIRPSFEIITKIDGLEVLKTLELIGRVCYKSEDKITDESCKSFVNVINTKKHHSVLEHFSISVRFINDRGFTHELVRHRLSSFSQESQRYVNYSKDKFDNQVTFIIPDWYEDKPDLYTIWEESMRSAEHFYLKQIELGAKPQEARGSLPNDTKTEIVMTANLREWLHVFSLRCSPAAHPTMHRLMRPLLKEFQNKIPLIFDDIVW